jgi:hypothetical protein
VGMSTRLSRNDYQRNHFSGCGVPRAESHRDSKTRYRMSNSGGHGRQVTPNVTIWKRSDARSGAWSTLPLIIDMVVERRLRYGMRFCCIA